MIETRAGASPRPRAFCLGLLAACLIPLQASAADIAAPLHKRVNFDGKHASRDVRAVADWVVESRNNTADDSPDLPFVIVDKKEAKVFVFSAGGRLLGAAPALLGMTRGDDSFPGIGDRDLAQIPPEQRTTPAGRFVASLSQDIHGVDLLMVDYGLNVAMHRVITNKPEERRLQRLATPTPLDNRISWGCINIPVKFYEQVVLPAFTGTKGIVYVLPEQTSARAFFKY